MSVGENIKRRRKQLNMSAESLAYAIGVSPTTIYRYENGAIEKVDSLKLEDIAKALNTTPSDLMGWDMEETSKKLHALGDQLTAPSRSKEWRLLSEGLAEFEKQNKAAFQATYNFLTTTYPEIFAERTDDDDT